MFMPPDAVPVGGNSPTPTQQPQGQFFMPKDAVPVDGGTQTQQPATPDKHGQHSGLTSIQNLLGSFGNFIGGIGNAVTHPVQTIEGAANVGLGVSPYGQVTDVLNKLGIIPNNSPAMLPDQTVGQVANNYIQKYSPQNIQQTISKDPVGVAADASTLLDGLGLLGEGSKLGEVAGVAADATNPVAPGAGVSAVLGKALNNGGQDVANMGNQLVLKGLRPSPSQLTKFQTTTGMDLADFLNKEGITGDFANQAQNKLDDLYEQYDKAASNPNVVVPMENLKNNFAEKMSDFTSSIHPQLQAKAQDMQNLLDAIDAKYKGEPTLENIVNERQGVDALLKQGQFSLFPEQASYLKNSRDALKATIDGMTEGKTKDLGTQIKNYNAFNDIAQRQQNLGRGSQPVGLIPSAFSSGASYAGGSLGGPIGALLGFIGGYGATKLMNNPKVVGMESDALKNTGNAMQTAGGQMGRLNNSNDIWTLLRNLGVLKQATTPITSSQ